MFNRVVNWCRNHHLKRDIASILHLPLIERLTHAKSRRVFAAVGGGMSLMLFGSIVASNAKYIEHAFGVYEVVVDTFGYFVHGIGAVPLLRYIEPLWTLLVGIEEAAV